MHFVLEMLGQLVREVHGVVAGPLAAGLPHAATGRPHVRTRSAQVEVVLGQLREDGLELARDGAQEHDVAGGAVHVGQAGAVPFPDVAQGAEGLRCVEPSGGLVDAERVEVGHVGELVRQEGIPPDHAAPVAHDAHDAAVLPVAPSVPVGLLELPQQVLAHLVVFRHGLDFLDETRPGALLEFVQERGSVVVGFCHVILLSV